MPTCPGCERTLPYERLPVHERYCERIRGVDRIPGDTLENLERRIRTLEARLERQIQDRDREIETRLARLEQAWQNQRSLTGE